MSTLMDLHPPVLRDDPDMITQANLARALNVTDRTLRNWEEREVIPKGVRMGGVKLYDLREIRKVLGDRMPKSVRK